MFEQFISEYGTTILYALLTTVAGIIGTWIGSIYKKYINDKTKEAVVRTVCKAIEQMYKDLHGEEKYNKAVESIVEMLSLKGITITELEIKNAMREIRVALLEADVNFLVVKDLVSKISEKCSGEKVLKSL